MKERTLEFRGNSRVLLVAWKKQNSVPLDILLFSWFKNLILWLIHKKLVIFWSKRSSRLNKKCDDEILTWQEYFIAYKE